MAISVRKYEDKDLSDMIRIWNEVVEDGVAFPQETPLDKTSGKEFFAAQTYCGVAVTDSGETAGLYILHPNNVGRCGHIANASYAVARSARGMGAGKKLVTTALRKQKRTDSAYCNSTRWSTAIRLRGNCTKVSDSSNSA